MFTRKKRVVFDANGLPRKSWFKRNKKLAILLIAASSVIVICGIVSAVILLNEKPEAPVNKSKETPKVEEKPPVYYSPLTGNEVATRADTTRAVTGIMIENSPDARPQSGLKDSGVVFEAIAEGGITRFLALYQEQKPQLIGPVRSVRAYYVDWVAAFNASVAHIGGSAAALAELRNGKYRDIDQFFNSAYYWRATDRYAPHNVYTSFQKLDELNAKKNYVSSSFEGFTRKDSKANEAPTATSISVPVSSVLFNSSYTYNQATNTYDRSQGGAPHMDREAGRISPRVVIAMMVSQSTVMEDGARQSINAVGNGNAFIFQDGTAREVKWSKASKTSQIKFSDENGKDVPLARGQTWITAVPNGKVVSWQ